MNEPFQTEVLGSASDQALIYGLVAALCVGLSSSQVGKDCRAVSLIIPFALSLAALPKEDLGGFYWRIFFHRSVWIAGKWPSWCFLHWSFPFIGSQCSV